MYNIFMAKYILKTYYGRKLVERFDHRKPEKLLSILKHPRMHRADQTDPWGVPEGHPTRFEIYDTHMEKLFEGNITDTIAFAGGL